MEKLTEDQLNDVVFDLGAARKGELSENVLHVFAAWISYLLSKMFKGRFYSRGTFTH